MQLCSGKEWEDKVRAYIGPDYAKCLHLYMDLGLYGTDDRRVALWAGSDVQENINVVLLKFQTTMHLYSRDLNFRANDVLRVIYEQNPMLITGQRDQIQMLKNMFRDKYSLTEGAVARHVKAPPASDSRVRRAAPEDAAEIARLICTDRSLSGGRAPEPLGKIMEDRFRKGLIRGYCLREDGRIVAYSGTTMEYEDAVILGDFIVHPDYRRKKLGSIVGGVKLYEIFSQGKEIYTIYYYDNPASKTFHETYDGLEKVAEWAKLEKNTQHYGIEQDK